MPLVTIPEITVYKRIQVKVLPRPDVPGAKPWMTVGELQLLKAAHERRQVVRRTILPLGLVIAAFFGLLELTQAVVAGAPSDQALTDQAEQVAQLAVVAFSKPTMPLAVSSATAVLEQKTSRSRHRYLVTVSLRLLQPLYVPAHSNGTQEYEQLRIGLENARAQTTPAEWQNSGDFPAALPQLVQLSHFAGEKVRITATLEAWRTGWRWNFPPFGRSQLVCQRPLQGSILSSMPHVMVYDEVRPTPELNTRISEIRTFLRRRAGADSAVRDTQGEQP